MSDPRRIVVVGGGVTGLSAAHAVLGRARELGREVSVTVLEGGSRFGGIVATESVDGFLLDGGPDSWVASKPLASALARELGLGGELVGTNEASRRYYVAWKGRLHVVPDGLVLGVPTRLAPLARTRLFSLRGKLRMAMEAFLPPRRDDAAGDESIAEFARRRLGSEAAERLVEPLLGGISAGEASDLSVRSAFPQLIAMEHEYGSLVRGMRAQRRAREAAARAAGNRGEEGRTSGSAFVSLAGGLGGLVDALVARLRVEGATLRLGATVHALARAGRGWRLELDRGPALEADEVLLAIPTHAAARLARPIDEDLGRRLAGFHSASTATVFLGYPRSAIAHPLDGAGFLVPRGSGRPLLAGTWVSSKWNGRAPDGHVLLRAFFGGTTGEEALGRDDEGLTRLARRELKALMGLDAEPVFSRVFRFERGSAQMRVGHAVAMRELRERLATCAPGLSVAGGGYDGIGIPDCIRQGQDQARTLLERILERIP
jgi:oxygen-dependent protoporphyrinogen oxidase